MKCEGCGRDPIDAIKIMLTNGALTLCDQCLRDINRKNPIFAKLESLRVALKEASDKRYQFLQERREEADKWSKEGDMWGWNFHSGMAAGANWCDLMYGRVRRAIEELLKTTK